MLDWQGPRSTTIAGAMVFLLGNFLFGVQKVDRGESAKVFSQTTHILVSDERSPYCWETVFDTYLIGYNLIALGSVAIFLSQFHRKPITHISPAMQSSHFRALFAPKTTVSNAFPQYSGVILAALTGAFDSSSVPYLIYREVFFKLGERPSL